jgi:cysteine desulfurase
MAPLYFDNAASTRVSDDVLARMTEVMRTAWGNPSAQHPQGAAARGHLATARLEVLAALGDRADLGDVIWTSGCTEADALAVLGAAQVKPGAIVSSTIEHAAVGALVARLGAAREVRQVAPGPDGVLDPAAVGAAAAGAGVAAIVMVQNEIGVIQPVAEIARAIREASPGCHIHLDAAQAFGKVPIDVTELAVDSIAIAGHKLHGPKGVGALWLRRGAVLEPLWVGGGQQHGLRGGTQDAPSAAGLGLAAARAVAELPAMRTRWLGFAAQLTAHLTARGVAFRQLVPDALRAPHILALGLAGVPAGALRTVLASRGLYLSTGSSCTDASSRDGHARPSPILLAIHLPQDTGMCRLSFSHDTTAAEVTAAAGLLADVALELAHR